MTQGNLKGGRGVFIRKKKNNHTADASIRCIRRIDKMHLSMSLERCFTRKIPQPLKQGPLQPPERGLAAWQHMRQVPHRSKGMAQHKSSPVRRMSVGVPMRQHAAEFRGGPANSQANCNA